MQSELAKLIKSCNLSKNQKVRWQKRGIIPADVLIKFWDMGLIITAKKPHTGMNIQSFLENLWLFAHSDNRKPICDFAMYIYENTVKNEMMPNWKKNIRPKKVRLYRLGKFNT